MQSISEITQYFKSLDIEQMHSFIDNYGTDERGGVQKLVVSAQKKIDALEKEKARIEQMKFYEHQYEDEGYICGIDEVGRGPLAGPVYAGAVILPKDCSLLYINDSKKLSEKKREELYEAIKKEAIAYAVGFSTPERIDEINILNATYEAMEKAVRSLPVKPSVLLVDAVHIPLLEDYKQVSIIKGDAKSLSIAAASIVAKVTRDKLMDEYAKQYPGYGFESNKGYGSSEHIKALQAKGPCEIHRRSFIGHFVNESDF